jgi:hypothetical protein
MDNLKEIELAELQNLKRVNNIVKRSENPHPLILCTIILCSMVVIYFIYITRFKPNINGQWRDDNNHIHLIRHNIWKDKLCVDNYNYGVLKGNMVVVYEGQTMKMGVLFDNSIYWTDSTSWHLIFGT